MSERYPAEVERRALLAGMVAAPLAADAALAEAAERTEAKATTLYERSFSVFDGKTLEQKIQLLADRAEIMELAHRYAHRVAQDESCADLFTDDGAFLSQWPGEPLRETRGRQAIDTMYGNLAAGTTHPKPMIHNHLIEISGHEAIGICSIEVRMSLNGESLIGSGWYDDSYRREGGRWKFVTRQASFFHYVPIQKGWVTN